MSLIVNAHIEFHPIITINQRSEMN